MVDFQKQVAALPWRKTKNGSVQVLLITSRETKRWVIPKGWPMKNLTDHNAAKTEAFEEAGVIGHIRRLAIGHFDYNKTYKRKDPAPMRVDVYLLRVEELLKKWPEANERKRKWFSVEEAAGLVAEPGLAAIISHLDPAVG